MTTWKMTGAAPVLAGLVALLVSAGKPAPGPAKLCHAGEAKVFSFVTTRGKTVCLCQGPKAAYLVYRFGTAAKTELQYPAVLDASSWQKFTYWPYHRGGGVANAGMEFYQLSFRNGGAEYTLIDQTSAYLTKDKEEDYHREVSLDVVLNGKPLSIPVRQGSVSGGLYLSDEQSKRVKLKEE